MVPRRERKPDSASCRDRRGPRAGDRLSALSPPDFEDVKMAADQADPDEKCKRMPEYAINGAEIAGSICRAGTARAVPSVTEVSGG